MTNISPKFSGAAGISDFDPYPAIKHGSGTPPVGMMCLVKLVQVKITKRKPESEQQVSSPKLCWLKIH